MSSVTTSGYRVKGGTYSSSTVRLIKEYLIRFCSVIVFILLCMGGCGKGAVIYANEGNSSIDIGVTYPLRDIQPTPISRASIGGLTEEEKGLVKWY